MPRSLDQVNHTVSIRKEPEGESFNQRVIYEFKQMQTDDLA